MENKSIKFKSLLFALSLAAGMGVFTKNAEASVYWVSPDGAAADLDSCSGVSPLSGADACSYDKVNGPGVVAGDTVYYRGGVYSGITGTAISPYNSGTESNRITFSAYNNEAVKFTGGDYSSAAVRVIKGNDWIKFHGLSFEHFGTMLRIGNDSAHVEDLQCNYIEVSHCSFKYMYNDEIWSSGTAEYYANRIQHSQYIWIHDSWFEDYGSVIWSPTSQPDFGVLFDVGFDNGDDSTGDLLTGNVLIDNCTFRSGLHHGLGTHGRRVLLRNSTLWSPPRWTIAGETVYGGRPSFSVSFSENDDFQHLYENNKIGYSADSPMVMKSNGWAGSPGLKFGVSSSIVRYNSVFKANLSGIDVDTRSAGDGDNIRWYNNTIWNNGYYEVHPASPVKTPANNYRYAVSIDEDALGNVFKNNIFWSNYHPGYTFCRSNAASSDMCSAPTTDMITNYTTISADNWLDNNISNPQFNDANSNEAREYDNYEQFDLSLQASSPCIDTGKYLTTANRYDDNIVSVEDARYFFDGWGLDGVWNILGAIIQPDTLIFSTSSTDATEGAIVKQISPGGVDWTNNRLVITGHGLSAGTTYYVWLYKDSSGAQVLYDTATDYGAHEFSDQSDTDTTPPAIPGGLQVQ